MRNFNILIFCWLFLASCNNNKHSKNAVVRDFLSHYRDSLLGKQFFCIDERPIKIKPYAELWHVSMMDSLKEKKFTLLDIEKWDKTYFKHAVFLSGDSLDSMRYSLELQRKFYKKHIGFYVISEPFISQDGSYILISINYICGDRCGYSKVQLFKAENGSWQLITTYSHGVS